MRTKAALRLAGREDIGQTISRRSNVAIHWRFVLKELTALLLGVGERFLTLGMEALRLVFAHHLAVAAGAFAVTGLDELRFVCHPPPPPTLSGFLGRRAIKTIVSRGFLGHRRAPASCRALQSVAAGAYRDRSSLDSIDTRRLACFGGKSKQQGATSHLQRSANVLGITASGMPWNQSLSRVLKGDFHTRAAASPPI
jgi:hypothetical protein